MSAASLLGDTQAPEVPTADTAAPKTWWLFEDLMTAFELQARRNNVRFYANKANNRITGYDFLRRRDHLRQRRDQRADSTLNYSHAHGGRVEGLTGVLTFSVAQMAADTHGTDPKSVTEGRKKRNTIARILDDLATVGAIEWGHVTKGAGQSVGLWARMLPQDALASRGAASSIGRASGF